MRLDVFLTTQRDVSTRSRAKNLIEMGFVTVNDITVKKAGFEVKENDKIMISNYIFASVGSFKLQKAIEDFKLDVKDFVCVDIGASNGGFTQLLIEKQAKKVYALDIGECALPNYLKDNPKVIVKDRLNARYINFDDIGEKVDLIVIDVSFISLKLIIPNMKQFLKSNAYIIALIKPQFENEKKDLNKKGIVKSKQIVQNTVMDISTFCEKVGFKVLAKVQAPAYFKDKNTEWLIYLQLLQ